jgi:hypothetical protein
MSNRSVTQSITIGFLWPVVFILMFLTGNCGVCGGDRDYVDQYLRAVDKAN